MARAPRLPRGVEKRVDRNGVTAYRASVSINGKKKRSPWSKDLDRVTRWRETTLKLGHRPGGEKTLHEAVAEFLALIEAGHVRTRSGEKYKPSVIRSYRDSLRGHVLPELGRVRLAEIDTPMLNRFVEMLVLTKGLSPSSCRNAVNPVRAILRRHVALGDLPVNAASGVMLPAARGGRVRSLSMDEIYAYIGAAPECDRAIWSTALLCGLRRGELGALQHSEMSMDRDAPRITVAASYDWPTWERVETKSRAGRRTVPIPSRLYEILAEHGMSTRRSGDDLVFGRTARTPFAPTAVSKRADAAWENAKLPGLTLHEARHCYASWVLAAGVQPVVLQGWLGHSTLSTTLNIYSHALPNADTYSAGLLEAAL